MALMRENVRLRVAYLGKSIEELAIAAGENPSNVRSWIRRNSLRSDTIERLAYVIGVPSYELLNPYFNPRQYPQEWISQKEEIDVKEDTKANSNKLYVKDGSDMS